MEASDSALVADDADRLDNEGPRQYEPSPLEKFAGGKLPAPKWAVQDIWPESAAGVIGGRPKDKKSTLAVELAISLASATPMFNLEQFRTVAPVAPVLYIQQENANTRVQRDFQKILAARGLGEFTEEQIQIGETREGDPIYETLVDFNPTFVNQAESFGTEPPRLDVLSHAGMDLSQEEDRVWLVDHVRHEGFKYVFLDPFYQLIGGIDEKDSAPLKPLLTFLTCLKNDFECAAILTHHMSDKGGKNVASSLLGSTFIHAWYEAALFTRSTSDHMVTVVVDAQRDMGTTEEQVVQGEGVGKWRYVGSGETTRDAKGRSAPGRAKKMMKLDAYRQLLQEHGDNWSVKQYAEALEVSEKTVRNYRRDLASQEAK